MKKLFLSIIALATSTVGYAQLSDGVSATLQAGETTTMFYGYDAFKDAIAAGSCGCRQHHYPVSGCL